MLCQTRWVERHTAFVDFATMYEAILLCLEGIGQGNGSWDAKSRTEASGLLKSISSSDFIAAFQSNNYCLGYTKQLSILLQGASQDILTAYEEIHCVRDALEGDRRDVDAVFEGQFKEMEKMARVAGLDTLAIPRICGRQTQRQNVPAESPLIYYRRAVFVPLLDHLIEELGSRFSVMAQRAVQVLCLLPHNLSTMTPAKAQSLMEVYENDLPSPQTFHQELKMWTSKWQLAKASGGVVPGSLTTTLDVVNPIAFPNIYRLLVICLTLPVTSATVERSNSALALIKTDLRSTMTQDRLNDLLLLFVHKDISIQPLDIVDRFARRHPRRMLLLNPLTAE